MAETETHREERHADARSETSPWEWAVAAVSTLLVLGALGVLLYEGIVSPSTPPQIEIAVDTVAAAGGGYLVTFWAVNRGHTTAASLTVEGELKSDTTSIETSTVTIDYVPSEARRQAGLFFSHDPRRYTLEIRPTGYDKP